MFISLIAECHLLYICVQLDTTFIHCFKHNTTETFILGNDRYACLSIMVADKYIYLKVLL